MKIVFFHIGDDTSIPSIMVASVRRIDPKAEIIQCSDLKTPQVIGTDAIFRLKFQNLGLMTSRLDAFANLGLVEPAVYVDTDILFLKNINIAASVSKGVRFCQRSFDRQLVFRTQIRGLDFHEHAGKMLGDVFPVVACFTISSDFYVWKSLASDLRKLPEKYGEWYGDQEAMRRFMEREPSLVSFLPESLVACPPEFLRPEQEVVALHFKGSRRKPLMTRFARELNLEI